MKIGSVIVGMGEIGGVFARGFLKSGRPVYPVTREIDINSAAQDYPMPRCVLIAVGENDLQPILKQLPDQWRDRVVLLQNELLPLDWEPHELTQPTIMSVWFEKKKGRDVKVVIPSPVFGPHSELLQETLSRLEIPVTILHESGSLLFELIRKNLYILSTNVCGLKTGGTVDHLWSKHQPLVRDVASGVLDIQEFLAGEKLDREALIDAMLIAFNADPDHQCMGRSAPARLERALTIAENAGLEVPTLKMFRHR